MTAFRLTPWVGLHTLGSTWLPLKTEIQEAAEENHMTFLGRVLRYLFWLAVVSWSVRLLQKLVGNMAAGDAGGKPYVDVPNDAVKQKLVRDPVCGMHVAEGLALPLSQGGETQHFCSVECRDKYLKGVQEVSASA